MQAQIENLVKLQAVELERTRLTKDALALPAEINQIRTALTAAERQVTDATAALATEDTLRTRLDREIDTHRKKAAHLRTQQDNLTTPAQADAVEHELHFAEAEAERLENEEFASLERTETQEAALTAARSLVEALAVTLQNTRDRVALRKAEIDRELATINAEREALRPLIEPANLMRFDRLCGSRGTGLARAERQQCTSCRMGIRPQTWNQLREGELLVCDSCSRLLYWDPAIEPAPAPEAPDPVAAASGRAIRKKTPSSSQ
jgi:predicted  nucleic acid-binding Zn-ribbon protein